MTGGAGPPDTRPGMIAGRGGRRPATPRSTRHALARKEVVALEMRGAGMADLRFCASQYQHLPLDSLRGRWRDAERRGFDVLWNCDTVVEPDRPRHTMFDGPATLAMMAAETSRIRVGTLVTSLYFRQPVTFAKAAVTVDHLSAGRVELALGVGDPSAGAKASGVDWPAGERVARHRGPGRDTRARRAGPGACVRASCRPGSAGPGPRHRGSSRLCPRRTGSGCRTCHRSCRQRTPRPCP